MQSRINIFIVEPEGPEVRRDNEVRLSYRLSGSPLYGVIAFVWRRAFTKPLKFYILIVATVIRAPPINMVGVFFFIFIFVVPAIPRGGRRQFFVPRW